jgi:hypothetical protein
LNELDPIDKGDQIMSYINESTLHHCAHTDNESHEIRALVSTGAQITLISKEIYETKVSGYPTLEPPLKSVILLTLFGN